MAKKKNKNKDFQKVKLKVGRKLVRGLNETKTDFKSKKIIVKELESRAKDPIKTLANGFSINNQTKLFCINNVDKWLNSTNINSKGGEVVTTVSRYLSDSDHRVRTDCVKCLKHCMFLMNRNQDSGVSPLMPIILTYINCGLTHIDHRISSDSLNLLSHFIDFSDKSLFNQLMQTIITLFERETKIDANAMEVCLKLVSLMFKDESDSAIMKKKEPLVLQWSPDNFFCDIGSNWNNERPVMVNLTFQTYSSVDIKKNFLEKVEDIVKTELKLLFPKKRNDLSLSVNEARKAVSAVKMALLLNVCSDIDREMPSISIIGINRCEKTNRKQSQMITHLRSELDASLTKLLNERVKPECETNVFNNRS